VCPNAIEAEAMYGTPDWSSAVLFLVLSITMLYDRISPDDPGENIVEAARERTLPARLRRPSSSAASRRRSIPRLSVSGRLSSP